MTGEQLEVARAERMRQNGRSPITFEDARTWMEETGLCLFLPGRQVSSSVSPSFVEAVAGHRNPTPDSKQIAAAEELLVRLEQSDVAVRLNLLGHPGEQPDFVVASWVLPYVYALRGDRDWRRSPQLTGSRQVSPLAVQAYKLLEAGEATVAQLKHTLGREVSESAVLRAITELWQQLRIIPVISAPGQPARWQLLRTRFQKAIAEGASTSQVTAISVLASIYLQAVIAASMEEVELFLAPLTARSKVREVLRGLVATRQVHTISLGHAPHFYVAGTLPEFAPATSVYASASMPASSYFLHSYEREEEVQEPVRQQPAPVHASPEPHTPRMPAPHKPAPAQARPHFSRPATHARDRKPAQSSSNGRTARHSSGESRSASPRWKSNGTKNNGTQHNGTHTAARNGHNAHAKSNGASRPATGARKTSTSATAATARRNGHSNGVKAAAKPMTAARNGRKPALASGAKTRNNKRYGLATSGRSGAKKRG